MLMLTSQILQSANFTKTQNLERNIIFSSNKKIHELHIKGYFMKKNNFVAEVTFKEPEIKHFIKSASVLLQLLLLTLSFDFLE